MSLLRWTSKSSAKHAESWSAVGCGPHAHGGAAAAVLGYSLQANAKLNEGLQPPDRDPQFRYLNDRGAGHIDDEQAGDGVDTKKKS